MSKVDAAKFVLQCQNWAEVAVPIATHKSPPRVILRDGTRFESQTLYWVDMYAIFFQGIYTPRYMPIGPNDLVVDIGANIGVFTVYAASRTSNKVYAVEPSPGNFQDLQLNIRSNNLSNVTALNLAISDKNGSESFFDAGASQHHHLKSIMHHTDGNYIDVSSMTLDELMVSHQVEQIDFLKLDCEGAEEAIFQSTSNSCLQKVRKIAMEFHDHLTQSDHNGFRNRLEKVGFTTRLYWDGKSVLGFIYAWRG